MAPLIALDELYSRYAGLVVAYLRGQGAADPEDLASEVFVGVVRGLASFQGDEAAFRSWLLVIAHQRLLDDRRRRGRKPADAVQHQRLHAVSDPGRFGDPEGVALERLATARVLGALARRSGHGNGFGHVKERPERRRARGLGYAASATQRLTSSPIPSIAVVMTWPGRR